ncbi:MAG: hypothetical protein P8P83_05350 [Rickettsiaceae bacterium]|nr:hypothetical protein [Rickettsiaceae bacterium]
MQASAEEGNSSQGVGSNVDEGRKLVSFADMLNYKEEFNEQLSKLQEESREKEDAYKKELSLLKAEIAQKNAEELGSLKDRVDSQARSNEQSLESLKAEIAQKNQADQDNLDAVRTIMDTIGVRIEDVLSRVGESEQKMGYQTNSLSAKLKKACKDMSDYSAMQNKVLQKIILALKNAEEDQAVFSVDIIALQEEMTAEEEKEYQDVMKSEATDKLQNHFGSEIIRALFGKNDIAEEFDVPLDENNTSLDSDEISFSLNDHNDDSNNDMDPLGDLNESVE